MSDTPEGRVIRVFVVDDSAAYRQFLAHMLGSDPRIKVVGVARDGATALELLPTLRPDVVTMDINMPGMDGYETTRRIMETTPLPIVVVSAAEDAGEVGMSFRAMESGAVAVVPKPRGGDDVEPDSEGGELIRMVKLMAEVKVVRRWPRLSGAMARVRADAPGVTPRTAQVVESVLIGASTGGPVPVRTILSALPREFPAAVLIVQHIAKGFAAGFAAWLSDSCRLPVRIAADREKVNPGQVYVAPDGVHMGVNKDRSIELGHGMPENGLRPSVSYLFRTAADIYGSRSVGILLSGMGKDGAMELKALKDLGATTFAQNRDTSVVFGMPGEAVRLGGASYVLPPESIAQAVVSFAAMKNTGERTLR
jgi:two-component system, chemotaxis family, protein-glutamate methylesterase/glutaminase